MRLSSVPSRSLRRPRTFYLSLLVLSSFGLSVLLLAFALPARAQAGAYVTDFSNSLVKVLDIDANPPAEIGSVSVGAGPVGVAVDSAARRVYITNGQDDTVSVIDASGPTPTVIATVPVGASPSGIVMDPVHGRVYVTNFDGGTLSVIDATAAPPAVVATVGSGDKPDGVAVSPDGSRVFVVDAEDHGGSMSEIVVFDGSVVPPAVITREVVPPEPHGLIYAADGRLYMANSDSNQVTIFDPVNLQVVDSVAVGLRPYHLAASPDGRRLYVTSGDEATLNVLDLEQTPPVIVDTATVGSASFGVGVSGDGQRVAVTNAFTGSVSVFDASTLPLSSVATVAVGGTPVSFGEFVLERPLLFQDGFESGDTGAWSTVVSGP